MNITKHGVLTKVELKTEQFKCEQCGCEFSADYDEYYVEKGSCITSSSSLSYVYKTNVEDTYVCSCPECNKIVTKTKLRLVENPTITLTGSDSSQYIPESCKNCSNHPSNGGSGNCSCTLGNTGKVTL